MEKLKTFIDLPAISDHEISKKDISLSSLWMVKDEVDKVFGPYSTESLKVYIAQYEYLFDKTKTYNLQSEKWHDTFSIPFFQRRQQIKNTDSTILATNEFFIYLNKQQSGPYTKDEIQSFLNNGQIKSSSELSIDKGETWIKVFEHHAFDRRYEKTNQELPFRPAPEVLEQMKLTKEEILKAKEQDDAIVELAFLGHQKSNSSSGGTPSSNDLSERNEKNQKSLGFIFTKKLKILTGAMASISLVLAFSFNFLTKMGEGNPKNIETLSSSYNTNAPERKTAGKLVPHKKLTQKKFVKRDIPKPKSRIQARRFPVRAKKKIVVQKEKVKDRFEQDKEEIDINDPDIQDEIMRALAGDEDLDPSEELDEDEEMPEDDYAGDEDPIMHGANDDDY